MLEELLPIVYFSLWALTVPYLYRQARQIQSLNRQLAAYIGMREKTGKEYQRIVNALMQCSRGVNDTLHEHDRRLRALSDKQETIAQHEPGSSRYREALTLIRRGADEDELVDACGLSRGEAHLIAHLERLQNRVA